MSEEKTQEQTDPRSFEERVFARFDAIDARLVALEERADERLRETKPIWEQALKEIADMREEMRAGFHNIERQIGVLSRDIVRLRADQDGYDERLARLESK